MKMTCHIETLLTYNKNTQRYNTEDHDPLLYRKAMTLVIGSSLIKSSPCQKICKQKTVIFIFAFVKALNLILQTEADKFSDTLSNRLWTQPYIGTMSHMDFTVTGR
jgi:hypothetical protein